MYRLIDRTLSLLDLPPDSDGKRVLAFAQGLVQLGIDWLEISPPVWQLLVATDPEAAGELPAILRITAMQQAANQAACRRFVSSRLPAQSGWSCQRDELVLDMRELPNLTRNAAREDIRITGLPDLILHDYRAVFTQIRQFFGPTVTFCPNDRQCTATALAIEWLLCGGKWVVTSFSGYGGFAATEAVLLGMRVIGRQRPNADWTNLPQVRDLFEGITGSLIPDQMPVIGRAIFAVEAGIHADGIAKSPRIYEPFEPSSVGSCRKLVIGKHSGLKAVQMKLAELGLDLSEAAWPDLLDRVQKESVRRRQSLDDTAFKALVEMLKNERGDG